MRADLFIKLSQIDSSKHIEADPTAESLPHSMMGLV
jgi:hypothetical protein